MRGLVFLMGSLLFQPDIQAQADDSVKAQVWQRELEYWQHVKDNDTSAYLKLWHDQFFGYPDTETVIGKDHVADWIPALYRDKTKHFEFVLERKLVNVFGDVAITFYDETDIWRNKRQEIISRDVSKITHTWKRFGNTWLIIGGMSAAKR